MNHRFDNLEIALHAVQISKKELTDKVETIEEQVLEQESRISSPEKSLVGLKDENTVLKLKVDDLKLCSLWKTIKIIGIPE